MQYLKITTIAIFACLNLFSFSQSNLDTFLNSVKQNNKTLKATNELYNAKLIETRVGLTPNNPEVEFGYFPGNSSAIGTKKVFSVTQSFDFLTIYMNQNKVAKVQRESLSKEFERLELNVLKQAKNAWYLAVFYNKKNNILIQRKNDAKRLYENYLKKQKSGDATQLEVNKALLFYINLQNEYRQNLGEIKQNNEVLKQLNGGTAYNVGDSIFISFQLQPWRNIKQEIQTSHPVLQQYELKNNLAEKTLKLEKSKWLPQLSIGYESETILKDTYSGFKGGIAIPLWQEKHNVKFAKANLAYSSAQIENTKVHIETDYFKRFINSETLFENYTSFKENMDKMNNSYLLQRSLELGQISAIEYFMELEFFYEVWNQLLELELEYHLSLTELFDYKN